MEKRLLKLKTAIELLDPDFNFQNLNQYEVRRRLQYLVYALQRSGLIFGYDYELRVNGPYCYEVLHDANLIYNEICE